MNATAILVTLLLASTLLPTAANADPAATTRQYSAVAYALDGEELLYSEHHVETWRRGRLAERAVRYEDAEGNVIATKRVDYGPDPAAPSFEMTDVRIGLRESVEVGPGQATLFSGPVAGDQRPKTVPLPEEAVIDAGFDVFMRENFSEIARGEKLEFDFAVPAARRFFRFQLVPEGELDYKGREAIRVKMKPANPFLRLLVDPVDLVYDRGGRLLEFRGLSNVCDERGERYKARIIFDYPERQAPAPVQVAEAAR